jgi:hypothetical protein
MSPVLLTSLYSTFTIWLCNSSHEGVESIATPFEFRLE